MPLISVILPVYNTEKYIKEAVESILSQTFKDFELIIINDASTDNTKSILETFSDKRLKIVNNPANLKIVKCLNIGLDLATGYFVARMDADDISLHERFERQLNYFKQNPDIDICGTQVQVFGFTEYILRPYEKHDDIKAGLLFINIITHPSVMFKREKFIKYSLRYNSLYINAEDYGLWIAAIDNLKFAIIPEVLIKYRIHDENVSVVKMGKNWEILKSMNFLAYSTIFKKLGMQFDNDELELHINLGFKRIEDLSKKKYFEYLQWLKKIVAANKKGSYYNHASLRNQILHNLIFLTKNIKMDAFDYWALTKTMTDMYGIKDYLEFIKYRSTYIKKTYNT